MRAERERHPPRAHHTDEPACRSFDCLRALVGLSPKAAADGGTSPAPAPSLQLPAPVVPSPTVPPRTLEPPTVDAGDLDASLGPSDPGASAEASDRLDAPAPQEEGRDRAETGAPDAASSDPLPEVTLAQMAISDPTGGSPARVIIVIEQDAGSGVAILQGIVGQGDASVVAWSTRPPDPPPPRVACGQVTCAPGLVCCNASCGYCTSPGQSCSKVLCGAPVAPVSIPCGPNTCNSGQVCCNFSCGICVPPGATCSQATCDIIDYPFSAPCGLNTCNTGQVCCNPSCGICTAPGESCSWDLCP